MPHACHGLCNGYETITFSLLSDGCRKRQPNVEKTLLTWKRASRHSCVNFFDISTANMASDVKRFSTWVSRYNSVHFSTAQLRKVHRHWSALAFWLGNALGATVAYTFSTSAKNCSGRDMFLTFWLGKTLRATAACNFWSLTPSLLSLSLLWLLSPLLLHLSISRKFDF